MIRRLLYFFWILPLYMGFITLQQVTVHLWNRSKPMNKGLV